VKLVVGNKLKHFDASRAGQVPKILAVSQFRIFYLPVS